MSTEETQNDELFFEKGIYETRGYVIHKAIAIEKLIDRIIIKYFLPGETTKADEFHDDFLKNVNFRKKILHLKSIISRLRIDLENDEYKKLPKLLNDIIELRDKMAHWQWVSVERGQFNLRGKKQNNTFTINDGKLKSFKDDCDECLALLHIIYLIVYKPDLRLNKGESAD